MKIHTDTHFFQNQICFTYDHIIPLLSKIILENIVKYYELI